MATLFVVSTPIGNREDITLRALHVLAAVDLIVAEDTRHSGSLLSHFDIHKPLLSLHEHNEVERLPAILARLQAGESVALISDAGTPMISDPGYRLISAVIEAGYHAVPIPGPSALLAALTVSGLPTDRFLFLGFPPRKASARAALLHQISAEPGTLIFYESARRLPALLAAIAAELGAQRPLVVARELTKLHETIVRGPAAEVAQVFTQSPPGEVVVLVGGAGQEALSELTPEVEELLQSLLQSGRSTADAARLLAAVTGLPRRRLYQLCLQLQAQ